MIQKIETSEANMFQTSSVPVRIITPIGMLGYGFDETEVDQCLATLKREQLQATALISDSGSTDSGPAKLAFGGTTCPRDAYKSDFRKMLRCLHKYGTPILVSSAGGDGSNAHVDLLTDIIFELQQEFEQMNSSFKRNLKVIKVYSEIEKSLVRDRYEQGRIDGCGVSVPALDVKDIERCPTIVAQMGPEPFVDAMLAHPDFDVIIGGRAYDPSPYVAYAAWKICKKPTDLLTPTTTVSARNESLLGKLYHMGKIMECGALCAVPKSQTALATVYSNGDFEVIPLKSGARCTPLSVAAHTFYEKSHPDILHGPGGDLDLTRSTYTQLDDNRSVRTSGAKFRYSRHESNSYTVKLEAAKAEGFRTIFFGGIRDPILISDIDGFLDRAKKFASSQHPILDNEAGWKLEFHVYGRDGVMGPLEPTSGNPVQSHEIFVVGECVANTQAKASAVADSARVAVTHGSYPGQMATGGNLAFGLGGKTVIEMGPCAEFAIYHLMQLDQHEERGLDRDNICKVVAQNLEVTHKSLFGFAVDSRSGADSWLVKQDHQRIIHSHAFPIPLPNTKDNHSSSEPQLNGIHVTNRTTDSVKTLPKRLRDVARVIRSKNAGPYEITLDVLFENPQTYRLLKESNLLTAHAVAQMYKLEDHEVICCTFFDQALGFKATIPRKGPNGKVKASGGAFETDVQGSQQYAGLFEVEIPKILGEALAKL